MGGYTATKAAQAGLAESLRANSPARRSTSRASIPISTPTEFIDAMARDFGHKVSGLGPKQSVDDVARAIVRCIRRPRPRCTRTRCRAA